MKQVWDYLSQFTGWHPYCHKVLAEIDKKKVPIPFNLNSIDMIFPYIEANRLSSKLLEKFGENIKIPILKLREENDQELKSLADFIYDNVFYGYTVKQWGLKPEELDPSVMSRVPVFIGRDDRYFYDQYQAIPDKGYTNMIRNIITHKNIEIMLNTDYKKILDDIEFDKIVYTGALDYYFDYLFGELPYRSLEFEYKTIDKNFFQETAQVNYPNEHEYTRITEFRHFLPVNSDKTTVAYEYPLPYLYGKNEPYYPIPLDSSRELYSKYEKEVSKLSNNVILAGRLAEYKYYNMDQVVLAALKIFEERIA
jgi:UDP-galactopyranose mutase